MAETRTIRCADCLADYETTRSNTKVCARCRLLRDLVFTGDDLKNCWICDKKYAPLDRKDTGCADCSYQPVGPGEAACMFCGETKLQVRRDTPVCHECAREPKYRGKMIGRLRKGQAARRIAIQSESNGPSI